MTRILRPWTDDETAILRDWYARPCTTRNGGLSLKKLARKLGRTYHGIRSRAQQIGLLRPRTRLEDVAADLRRMHGERLSMYEMGDRLRISEGQARRFLLKLGLPLPAPHAMTVAGRKRHQANYAKWLAREGVRNLREYTLAQERAKAQARWPIAETGRQADLLDLLAEGPARIADLARWMGYGKGWVEELLRRMQRTGAVVKSRTWAGYHRQGGCPPCIYDLSPGVERADFTKRRI